MLGFSFLASRGFDAEEVGLTATGASSRSARLWASGSWSDALACRAFT